MNFKVEQYLWQVLDRFLKHPKISSYWKVLGTSKLRGCTLLWSGEVRFLWLLPLSSATPANWVILIYHGCNVRVIYEKSWKFAPQWPNSEFLNSELNTLLPRGLSRRTIQGWFSVFSKNFSWENFQKIVNFANSKFLSNLICPLQGALLWGLGELFKGH